MKIKLILFGLIALTFAGCKKFMEPDPEIAKSVEDMYDDPQFGQAFLVQAYRTLPAYYNYSEVATDDAVANLRANAYSQVATGSWTAANGTLSVWNSSYSAIQYINQFLDNSNKVKWANDPVANTLLNLRMRGEAYGLRALHMYYLLRHHAGLTPDGQLMGVPILTKYQETNADFNQPRATFDACVKQIYLDLDSAERFLPMEYVNLTASSQIPDRFKPITQNYEIYNRAMGQFFKQLFNGLIAKSIRSKTALLAASPAFQHPTNKITWADAANASAAVVKYRDSLSGVINTGKGLPATGYRYYDERTEIDALSDGNNPAEIIWREIRRTNADRETLNFPPTLFGSGLVNPTQNLVDAFPMDNGYPIGHASANYNSSAPFTGRDKRLREYILYNAHPDLPNIRTGSKSGTNDGVNVLSTSTRTGYYLRKTLRWDVNLTPGSVTTRNNYIPRIRYTEIYLNYAEAANEAWGPKGAGTYPVSAYDVIKAIRSRAGLGVTVGTTKTDPYLEECANDKVKMRELIRNERRLELSFEGFRFWDLRRWNSDLKETARGMDINGTVFTPIPEVEQRTFQSYMIYGPIPNSEVLKYSNLVQNAGWR